IMPSSHRASRHYHSFPTRRSSDLLCATCHATCTTRSLCATCPMQYTFTVCHVPCHMQYTFTVCYVPHAVHIQCVLRATCHMQYRSEEHKSELQSQDNLVCRLFLEI